MTPRWLPHPLLTPLLAAVWLLLADSLTVGHLALGLLLGWVIPLFTLRFWPDPTPVHRPLALARFLGLLLWDIVIANLTVAPRILGRPDRLRPLFVRVPLSLKSDLAISLLANAICLTPGTVSARLTPDRGHLVVHALDETDGEALIATIKRRYEAPLREVFERC